MNGNKNNWSYYSLGDHALVFALAPETDVLILQKIKHLNAFIVGQKIKGILDLIPSYHTLTIVYDIHTFFSSTTTGSNHLLFFCNKLLNDFENDFEKQVNITTTIIQVPVCYEKIFGVDLENISLLNCISCEEIIKIHTSIPYDVYSIGFLPGFTYMGMVNEKIQIARHGKPRKEVIAGSVGIADLQTGIYPSNSPGGWQIIGRTPWKIFDPLPHKLAKFKVGDRVQFYPISQQEFDSQNEYN